MNFDQCCGAGQFFADPDPKFFNGTLPVHYRYSGRVRNLGYKTDICNQWLLQCLRNFFFFKLKFLACKKFVHNLLRVGTGSCFLEAGSDQHFVFDFLLNIYDNASQFRFKLPVFFKFFVMISRVPCRKLANYCIGINSVFFCRHEAVGGRRANHGEASRRGRR
jgi:hypothetical protein